MTIDEDRPRDRRAGAAIIGSGNIGTDLMIKVMRRSKLLRMEAMVGIDPESEGLLRADRLGVPTTDRGIDGLLELANFDRIRVAFDATSAGAHPRHDRLLRERGVRIVDLTPAAVGPYVVPVVNGDSHLDAPNVNMVTCGGQATVPIVAAVAAVAHVPYAEIVSSIASRSAGPGTRANIDEFTETTARALVEVGGADRGKAVIVLNPAEPPVMMRNTIYCLVDADGIEPALEGSVERAVAEVASYVPGYRLKQRVQFETFTPDDPLVIPETGKFWGTRVTVFVEVTGEGNHLPPYAGNLDIMTSAALLTGERIAARELAREDAR